MSDPPVMVPDILAEFLEFVNDMAGTHYFCTLGLWEVRRKQEELVKSLPPKDDRRAILSASSFGEGPLRLYGTWKMDELIEKKLGRDGEFSVRLGRLWVTEIYGWWDSRYRKHIAGVLGKEPTQFFCDEIGDLRLMRDDILHNRSRASLGKTGRCISLRWFGPNDPIRITTEHVLEFNQKMGVNVAGWIRTAMALRGE